MAQPPRPRKVDSTYFVSARGRTLTVCRQRDEDVINIDVPRHLIDVLAYNMPRLLQLFRHWDRDHTGEISQVDFERALYALGVRYRREQVKSLFRLLDADTNGHVSLDELLMLKFASAPAAHACWRLLSPHQHKRDSRIAVDNHIGTLPGRPGLASERDTDDEFTSKQVKLRIEDVDKVERGASLSMRFCSTLAKPMLGMVWKSSTRPHHALALFDDLEHTRGPPAVHAPMRVCKRPEMGAGFHVQLTLVPLRGALQGERHRFVYQSGGDADALRFCAAMYEEIEHAAERATSELNALLGEVRQMDLKLEEVRLRQPQRQSRPFPLRRTNSGRSRGGESAAASTGQRELVTLKRMLRAIAADTEESVVAQLRYTRRHFHPRQGGGIVRPHRIVRFKDQLLPHDGTRRRVRFVASLSFALLVVAAACEVGVTLAIWDDSWRHNYEACEFQQFACRTRPWQYACANGSVVLRSATVANETCASVIAPLTWGNHLLGSECDGSLQRHSPWFALPLLPLCLATVVLPVLGLFWNNAHRITVKKVLVWTPIVPLILIQCVVRAAVLASCVPGASDQAFAIIEALVGFVLVFQVAVFLLMDAMRYPTPALRIAFAIALLLRFGFSLLRRSLVQLSAEQDPLFATGVLAGVGSSTRQAVVSSIDWTVTAMLFSSILSVVQYPGEMAVVRLRCDIRHYFNWRDCYMNATEVRAHRRDLDAADAVLWARAKFPVWLDQQAAKVQHGLSSVKSFGTRSTRSWRGLSSRRHASDRSPSRRHASDRSPSAVEPDLPHDLVDAEMVEGKARAVTSTACHSAGPTDPEAAWTHSTRCSSSASGALTSQI